MARRITDEQIEQINKLYYEIGIKSQVAKIVGVSPSTVARYIIPDWKPTENRNIKKFDGEINSNKFIEDYNAAEDKTNFLIYSRELSDEEWEELRQLQKEEL